MEGDIQSARVPLVAIKEVDSVTRFYKASMNLDGAEISQGKSVRLTYLSRESDLGKDLVGAWCRSLKTESDGTVSEWLRASLTRGKDADHVRVKVSRTKSCATDGEELENNELKAIPADEFHAALKENIKNYRGEFPFAESEENACQDLFQMPCADLYEK